MYISQESRDKAIAKYAAGSSATKVGEDFNVSHQTILNWVGKSKRGRGRYRKSVGKGDTRTIQLSERLKNALTVIPDDWIIEELSLIDPKTFIVENLGVSEVRVPTKKRFDRFFALIPDLIERIETAQPRLRPSMSAVFRFAVENVIRKKELEAFKRPSNWLGTPLRSHQDRGAKNIVLRLPPTKNLSISLSRHLRDRVGELIQPLGMAYRQEVSFSSFSRQMIDSWEEKASPQDLPSYEIPRIVGARKASDIRISLWEPQYVLLCRLSKELKIPKTRIFEAMLNQSLTLGLVDLTLVKPFSPDPVAAEIWVELCQTRSLKTVASRYKVSMYKIERILTQGGYLYS